MLYCLFSDKNYCNNDLKNSCPALKPLKNFSYLFCEFK